MRWKPKYKVGDVVCTVIPSMSPLPITHKFGFGAKGTVTDIFSETGYYRIKLTKIYFDNYFIKKPTIGATLLLHFQLIEGAAEKLKVELDVKEKVVFT